MDSITVLPSVSVLSVELISMVQNSRSANVNTEMMVLVTPRFRPGGSLSGSG